ncbi:ShlB/FhaC/HecB family hemolysin secretion/activation protein [Neorhizobium sp. BETTINA12A]|uniref:ShlB/FhaC/HecB family hemolysin secretion/activation protein n=1 Tax=Neorhizobium sp. BETTINA12A TaxID=2908924 RepID=UPI001FF68520|nr:ShlB/FhaC/HecB family hemolysin secretion/activation protein [Neorhizobium sp. BETTINA12A]MCJ9749598.1 ShlB/FhaC/HecB family hemolysin secretion/activation protein [Neorhizobium sp. BETTINA12A]
MLFSVGPVLAQTASQVTPQTFEPKLQKQARGIVIPEGAEQAAPAGAEKLDVHIGSVVVEGGLPALTEDTAKLKAELAGKTVTAADLFAAASRLQAAYAAKGYPLVRVLLPAQRLVNGATLRIAVIDGFLERIDTSHLPDNIRQRVAKLLAPLVSKKSITNAEIERRVLLAGDLPGIVLRSTLSRGTTAGGSVLTIEARYKPVLFSLNADNRQSDQLGKYNTGMGIDFNSVFGFGELIYLRASGAPRFDGDTDFFSGAPRNRMLAGGVTLPLGNDGLSLNLEATVSRTAPEAEAGSIAFQSDFTRYSAKLNYPLIRSRNLTLNLTGAFDAQQEKLSAINLGGVALSKDRLRVLRTGADLSWYVFGDSLFSAGLTGSFGINGLGARSAADAAASDTPLSRQGADADFQKLELTLGYRQPVAEHLTFDLVAKAQTSFGQPLLNSEQIGLASTSGLSTFPSGLMQGDDGFVVRAEAQFPFTMPFSLPFALSAFPAQQGTNLPADGAASGAFLASPYLFGAYGGVRLHQPTALEAAWTQGASYGAGLRLGAAEQASFNSMTLSLEYGRTERFGDGSNDNRFTLSAAFQF